MRGRVRVQPRKLRDSQAAGLLKPFAVKAVVARLEKALIIRQLGELTVTDLAAFKTAIWWFLE